MGRLVRSMERGASSSARFSTAPRTHFVGLVSAPTDVAGAHDQHGRVRRLRLVTPTIAAARNAHAAPAPSRAPTTSHPHELLDPPDEVAATHCPLVLQTLGLTQSSTETHFCKHEAPCEPPCAHLYGEQSVVAPVAPV